MERRVFILAPCGKDAALMQSALERAQVEGLACASADDVVRHAADGIGCLLVTDEALLHAESLSAVQRLVADQPAWSDLPVLLLSHGGKLPAAAADALQQALGNVTVLHRPTQIATLVSMVRTALRTRERQYEAREASARKDMFLAALAHELRNPLAPLSNALHLLQASELPHPQQQRAVGVIQRQARQLSRLVDDLLDVARITRGKITLRKERLDLRDAVHMAIETSLPVIEGMEHHLEIDLPDTPAWVSADPARMAQCIGNLLANAAKYTPRRGRIGVALRDDGDAVELTVRDDGMGFRPQEAARLFDVFAQIERATPQAQGGLGLGLSIVKALIGLHSGTVEARSDGEGRGAVFTIRVPRASAPAPLPPAEPASHGAASPARELRVLVVDDNQDSADSMTEVLVGCGHETRTAYSGQGALAILAHWEPQVALLDIGLPDMTGHELARQVRERCAPARPLLVALTGWGQAGDVARSLEAGFDHHLTKPADIGALLALLDTVAPPIAPPMAQEG